MKTYVKSYLVFLAMLAATNFVIRPIANKSKIEALKKAIA